MTYAIQSGDIVKAKSLLESIDNTKIDHIVYQKLYLYASTKYRYLNKEINYKDYYQQLQNMVQVDQFNLRTFSSLEVMVLFELSKIEIDLFKSQYNATQILTEALQTVDTSYITNDTIHTLLPVYEIIVKYNATQKNYKTALKLCYIGIELSKRFYSYQSLRSFYYMIGLISVKNEDYETAEEFFTKCLYTIVIKDKIEMFQLFKGYILSELEFYHQTETIERLNQITFFNPNK